MCTLILPPWVNFLPPNMKLLQNIIKQSITLTWPISTSRCWMWTTHLQGKGALEMTFWFYLWHYFQRSVGRCGGSQSTQPTCMWALNLGGPLHTELPRVWPSGLQFKWALQVTCRHTEVLEPLWECTCFCLFDQIILKFL